MLVSLAVATALLLGSPGPVPVALAATGATYGVRNGIPFLTGVVVGLTLVLMATLAGLFMLLALHPAIEIALLVLSTVYLLYIAFKIATASTDLANQQSQAPSLKDGVIFNLINPKAYAAILALLSPLTAFDSGQVEHLIAAGAVIVLVGLLVDSLWLAFGGLLKPVFVRPQQQLAMRYTFASLLVAVTIYGGVSAIRF